MGVKGLKTQSECKAVIFIGWLSYSDYSIHLKIKKSEKITGGLSNILVMQSLIIH